MTTSELTCVIGYFKEVQVVSNIWWKLHLILFCSYEDMNYNLKAEDCYTLIIHTVGVNGVKGEVQ